MMTSQSSTNVSYPKAMNKEEAIEIQRNIDATNIFLAKLGATNINLIIKVTFPRGIQSQADGIKSIHTHRM